MGRFGAKFQVDRRCDKKAPCVCIRAAVEALNLAQYWGYLGQNWCFVATGAKQPSSLFVQLRRRF